MVLGCKPRHQPRVGRGNELGIGLEQAEFTNEVVLACDGAEAIDYLLANKREANEMPCLVLLDLHMLRLDGFGMLRRMGAEERTRFVPVVMLSSSDRFPVDFRE